MRPVIWQDQPWKGRLPAFCTKCMQSGLLDAASNPKPYIKHCAHVPLQRLLLTPDCTFGHTFKQGNGGDARSRMSHAFVVWDTILSARHMHLRFL